MNNSSINESYALQLTTLIDNEEYVKKVISHSEFDITQQESTGFGGTGGITSLSLSSSAEVTILIINAGADLNAKNTASNTPLYHKPIKNPKIRDLFRL